MKAPLYRLSYGGLSGTFSPPKAFAIQVIEEGGASKDLVAFVIDCLGAIMESCF
jgi:hypothetical protein